MKTPAPLSFGWEEWVSLPDLGLPAINAKVDTGARTSALHADDIELVGTTARPKVRFTVHPEPGRMDVAVSCIAPVHDRREVTSSNGESEMRIVIRTKIAVGGQTWPIDVTLTNRNTMASRMLLGRQALNGHITITATERNLQPVLSYDVYHTGKTGESPRPRLLDIAILSREDNYSTTRLVEAGEARGHRVTVIDTTRCYMAIDAITPGVHYDGKRLPRFDAVIPRIGASITPYGTAVVRQFESIGTVCLNPSAGISASRDRLQAHQILARQKVGMPTTAFASSPKDTDNLIDIVGTAPLVVKLLDSTQGKGVVLVETRKAAQSVISVFRDLHADFLVQDFVKEASGSDIRCIVVGGRVVASIRRQGDAGEFRSNLNLGGTASPVKITKIERDAVTRAARAFRLGVAGVDFLRSADGPKVLEVNSTPGLDGIEQVTGKDIASAIYDEIEKRLRPTPARRPRRSGA